MNSGSRKIIHEALGSGRWFPGSKRELHAMVNSFLDAADVPAISGKIVGAISPHAGYIYSGKVSGYTFRALRENSRTQGSPHTVVVLGFSHRGGLPGVAVMDGDAIETPLGAAPLDREAAEALVAADTRIRFDYRPHAGEHSAENQVPFIQVALPSAKLVLALIGDHDERTIAALVSALNDLAARKRITVVASTDLLHDPDYDLVTATDETTMRQIAALDITGLQRRWSYANQVCCGIGPVLAVMRFAQAQGCRQGVALHYRNSGDDYPESRGNWVVGYGAIVFPVAD